MTVKDKSVTLGKGEFGIVYKGTLKDVPEPVAFKTTHRDFTSKDLKYLMSEIKIMIHVGKHPNVLAFIGAYTAELPQGSIIPIHNKHNEGIVDF